MLGDNWHLVCVVLSSLLVVVVITSYWVFSWRNPRCSNGGKLPPGSMGFPLIGETIQFFLPSNSIDTPAFIKTRVKKYGPLFKTSLMGRRIVVSTDPEFSYNLLLQEGKLAERDSGAQALSKDKKSRISVRDYKLLKHSILGRFGSEPLKNGTLMAELEKTISISLHRWSELPQVELKTVTTTMIINFMAKKVFSYEPDRIPGSKQLTDSFANFLGEYLKFPINIPGITSWRRCFKVQKKLMAIIADTLESRKRFPREKREDYLDDIMEMMPKEDFLTDKFVVFVMFAILFASFETISSTIVIAIKFLSDHPLMIQKLQVIKESLRISSVSPGLPKKALTDIDADGYTIPKGWTVLVIPSAIQLNSTVYEDPLSFNPSRWEVLIS
ncbi:Cytochrome P450 87A3 [Linum grandiflorum]